VDEASAKVWLRTLPECDDDALARLERLVLLLAAENARQNLVSAASLAEVWVRHIGDSAQLLAHVPRETSPWLDLGTGAGFPGLVVAALRPACEVILVESRKRRVAWLMQAADTLGLENVRVWGQRLEDVPTCKAAVISARAFAPLGRLLDLSARFSTSDTLWLLPKGRSAQQELDMLFGWTHMFHVEQSLTDGDAGVIVGRLLGPAERVRKGKTS
jgi:16S rRNA (guanine527-N7)-methyltransferase